MDHVLEASLRRVTRGDSKLLFDALEMHLTSIGGSLEDKRKEMPEVDVAYDLHHRVCG